MEQIPTPILKNNAQLCLQETSYPDGVIYIGWQEECGYYPTSRIVYTLPNKDGKCIETNIGLTRGEVCVARAQWWTEDGPGLWGGYNAPYFFLPEPSCSLLLITGLVGLILLKKITGKLCSRNRTTEK